MGRLREDFHALIVAGDRFDMARAALAIARIAYPTLDPSTYLRRLDALAAAVRPRLAPEMPAEEAAAVLATYLFAECGFRGNRADYYDPRNSFLNDVIERRTGIPITLALIFIEVSTRLGLRVEGVGFPGHFLVRVIGAKGSLLLDPFFGGRVLSAADLLSRWRESLGAERAATVERLPAEALATAAPSAILSRMLRNLLRIYLERGEHPSALETVDLLLVLVPDAADETRVRGLLYEHLECFGAALEDFARYLELAPNATDVTAVRERMARLARAVTLH
jgi:regulator of sirC expression with transglutaminase-like and TPR domain